MKKTMKIVSILMMAIMMLMIATPVFAVDPTSAINSLDGKINYTGNGNDDFTTKIGNIIGFLQWAGAIAGVLIITIFGIKYMMGSLEEKAEYKKSMIPLVVGVVVVMGATTIANLLIKTFTVTPGT